MNRKNILILILLSIFAAVSLGAVIYELVTWSSHDLDNEPVKLGTPEVVLEGNLARWDFSENAEKYEILLSGAQSFVDKSVTKMTLADGQSLKIRAIGNETDYITSEWSNTVIYNAPSVQKLSVPIVSITTDGVAVWEAVDGAVGYVYKIDNASELFTRGTSVALAPNQSIRVKAIGDGKTNLDSEFSAESVYAQSKPEKLETPTVNISESGVASWEIIAGATAYIYLINGTDEYRTENTEVLLSPGMSISVKAVSDREGYIDGDFSEEKTYTLTTPSPEPDPEPEPDPDPEPDPEPEPEPDPEPDPEPVKLPVPLITVSDDGLASWTEVVGATEYVYKIDGGAETATRSTSVQLSYCQKITVKALGDGKEYADSDYAEEAAYIPTSPDFLGFSVLDKIPDELDFVPLINPSLSVDDGNGDYVALLEKHFEDKGNYLGNSYPKASDYHYYAKPYDTVYLAIFLDNARQYEILSVEFNEVEYTAGQNLLAFNFDKDGKIYTCVYVQVTLPGEAHEEFSYTVSNIEYLENLFVEQSKLDNKDTAKIGLPYAEQDYSISNFEFDNREVSNIDYKITVSGNEQVLAKTGGWLGLMLYRGSEIIYNGSLSMGDNSISISGLLENTEYVSVVYLYADLHDGNGVTAHTLYYSTFITERAIVIEALNSGIQYDSIKERYYPEIMLQSTLKSMSARYIKLELYDAYGNLFYTDLGFKGQAVISNGILNGAETTVKIYYSDDEYPEGRSIEKKIYVPTLGEISLYAIDYCATLNSVIYKFTLGNDGSSHPYVQSFKFLLYDKTSSAYIAENVLKIINNQNAVNIAHSKYQAALIELERVDQYTESDEYLRLKSIADKLHLEYLELSETERILEQYYPDKMGDIEFWESELLKGKYYYEIEYSGQDTDSVFRVADTYYVILHDYFELSVSTGHFIKVVATLDKNDGKAASDFDFGEVAVDFEASEIMNTSVYPENLVFENGKITFSLSGEDDSEYHNLRLGYVHKLIMTKGDDVVELYSADAPPFTIDDAALIFEYKSFVKSGEPSEQIDLKALIFKQVGSYAKSEELEIDESLLAFGEWTLSVYTRLCYKEYGSDEYEAVQSIKIDISRKLATPSVSFEGQYAVFRVVEGLESDVSFTVEIKDKDGNVASLTVTDNRVFVPVGGAVRVKAKGDGYSEDSDWSAWLTLSGEEVEFPWIDFVG